MKNIKKFIFIFIIFLITIGLFILGIYIFARYSGKITITSANQFYILDNNELLVDNLNENWVKLEDISDNLLNATISIEDKNFYNHAGFDIPRIIKSIFINIKSGENMQGASTISQQLSKNLFLSFEKTWKRKAKEAWLTIKVESQYDKDTILEAYLNTINYGGIYGIENASKYYFHKSAKDLTLAEASILAGIPKSPSKYSPISNLDNAKERQLLILNSMRNNKYISDNDINNAYKEKLTYYGNFIDNDTSTIMYYKDAVMDELNTIEEIPKSLTTTGGLKIYTYLDIDAQQYLETAMKKNITNKNTEIAGIMMIPDNGHVVALIGGKDYSLSQYNRATKMKRQMGSTLKPFLYYAALENGFTSSTTFTSEKTTFVFSNNKTYSPNNFNDKYANSEISMPAALAYSDNIYAVKTHIFLGEDTLVKTLKRVGITTDIKPIPSLALGSVEMKLIDVTSSYATLANMGNKVKAKLIKRVEDINGNILYENKDKKEEILNSSLTYIMNENLTSTYNKNFINYNYPTCFDISSSFTNKYSIKTGTTNKDHLVFGYNKDIVIGLWSGYDNNLDSELYNGKELRYMWRDTIENYFKDKNTTWYDKPENVVATLVDPITGKIANKETKNPTLFYYIKGTEPTFSKSLDSLIPTLKEESNTKKK